MTTNGNHVVADLAKNRSEKLRVQLTVFNGHQLLDVRSFVQKADGAELATRKGISLKVERLPDLIATLQKAQADAESLGWLSSGTAK